MMGQSMHDTFRAQVDTAAETTVTPHQHLLHRYCPYTDTFCSLIRLVAILDTNSKVSPLGKRILRIPSEEEHCLSSYVDLQCYFTPQVSSTLLNKNNLYGPV